MPPPSYFEMLGAMRRATVVVTDSGGPQGETTALSVPGRTVGNNTERLITMTEGTSTLVGSSPDALRAEIKRLACGESKRGRILELWDGKAAERIAAVIAAFIAARRA
jgi:UDP-N-acetylglucosamine 2-epimerase (non-hydrolysing)